VHLQNVPPFDKQDIKKHPEVSRSSAISNEYLFANANVQSRFILSTLSLLASVSCNLSITHLYTSIFPHRRFRVACHILVILTACYGIAFFVASFFSCPRPQRMDMAMAAECMNNIGTIWVAASAVGVCIDLANSLLPMPILWGLNVDFGRKIRLTLLFGLGFLYVVQSPSGNLTDVQNTASLGLHPYASVSIAEWTCTIGHTIPAASSSSSGLSPLLVSWLVAYLSCRLACASLHERLGRPRSRRGELVNSRPTTHATHGTHRLLDKVRGCHSRQWIWGARRARALRGWTGVCIRLLVSLWT
jgi:hypothetical protein